MDFLVFIAEIFGSSLFDATKSAKQDKTLLWMMIIGCTLFGAFGLTLYYLAQHS
ncbi:hypothetical protein ACWXWU_13835 [Shewanella sp. A14]